MTIQPGTLSADYKAPGGKLLRARLRLQPTDSGPVIETFQLSGDFFIHPEEALETLETALVGAPFTAEALRARVTEFYAGDVQVIGAGIADIVAVILNAH